MRKLPAPQVNFTTSYSEAVKGVGDAALKKKYTSQITNHSIIENDYINKARSSQLYSLPRTPSVPRQDPIVHGTLRKSDFMKLYTQYFVPDDKPARTIYNQLKVTANGKCPFCGDIGHVRTLDHFIPKANFPLYSVLPSNLIPCCRDCNSDKLNSFSQTLDGQTLHPYFDDDKYFTQKWVHARVIPSAPPVIEFYVSPPDDWKIYEKSRVSAHFIEYNLAERFGVEAGADISETILTRKTTLSSYSPEDFSAYLREKSDNSNIPINNWRRVMFLSLSEDEWFCNHRH